MRLSLKVFGFEIASLDFETDETPAPEVAVRKLSKPVKLMSKLWVGGMTA
ncbi:hypothetical protein PBI_BOGOSYJAY_65 [Mycobacterium phage BogosyJay]|nr:hypothetical protein PBI_MAMINIAINA_65 [Mycobacterium phage Maminiaina]QFG14972.1 hypothetical protein PBI_BOGOSYJAY_65 [Mycobacterium phage BogosyJay]